MNTIDLATDGGHWVTINGVHVKIDGDGNIVHGPDHLMGTKAIPQAADEVDGWIAARSQALGISKQQFTTTEEYRNAYPHLKTLHAKAKAALKEKKSNVTVVQRDGKYVVQHAKERWGKTFGEKGFQRDTPTYMGTGGDSMSAGIAEFATKEEAANYAKKHGYKVSLSMNDSFYLSTSADTDLKPAVTLGQGYPTHLKLKVGSEEREVPVAYFWKDSIQAGEYVHPATKQTLKVDASRIDGWVDKFHQMRAAGIEIPTPTDHSSKAEDNLGFVIDAKRNGDRLSLLHQVIGEDAAMTALRNRCSLCIEPDYVDEKGRKWGDAFTHSAFTPVPVVSGMGSFVPFAASRDRQSETPIFYLSADEGDPEMDFKQLREALGATADIPDDKLLEKVKELRTTATTALSRATAAEQKVTDLTTQVTNLSRTPTPPDPEALRDRMELSLGKIDLSVERGDMPPFIAKKLKEKVGTVAAPNTFMLSRSADLGDRPVDYVLSLFDGAKLCPKTGSQTGIQQLSRPTPDGNDDGDKVDPETIKARAAAVSGASVSK